MGYKTSHATNGHMGWTSKVETPTFQVEVFRVACSRAAVPNWGTFETLWTSTFCNLKCYNLIWYFVWLIYIYIYISCIYNSIYIYVYKWCDKYKLLIYSLSSPDFLPIIHLLASLRMATLKVPGRETAPRPNYPEYPMDI